MLASGNNDVTSHPKTEYNPMGSICLFVDVLKVLQTEHSSKIDFANHCAAKLIRGNATTLADLT